jgi:hypothetical protein
VEIKDDSDKPAERRAELYAIAISIIGFVVVWWWALITPPLA